MGPITYLAVELTRIDLYVVSVVFGFYLPSQIFDVLYRKHIRLNKLAINQRIAYEGLHVLSSVAVLFLWGWIICKLIYGAIIIGGPYSGS